MTVLVIAFFRALVFLSAIAASMEDGGMENLSYSKKSDLVVDLPGQPPMGFKHYAGYINVSEDKALFYWFFEAMEAPTTKPLVSWLGGGPGCSSIGRSLQGISPFLVTNHGFDLKLNPHTWSKAANLLFLESPIGVGFSYSNKSSDLERFNDQITANDAHTFLINWFDKFPMFKSRGFYIGGASYAGHYGPQLAELIHERNKITTKSSYIKLKGLLIGNPVLDWLLHYIMTAEFAWSHGMISHNLYRTVIDECPLPKNYSVESWNRSCNEALQAVDQSFAGINWYNINMPNSICHNESNRSNNENERGYEESSVDYDSCTGHMEFYLNRDDVQRALHANVTGLPYPFSVCSDYVYETYNKYEVSTVVPIIQKLLDAGYRVWIYSGEADAAIPFEETRKIIMDMKLTEKIRDKWGGWRKWYYEGQVAGWMVEYVEGLSFISVRGAGHVVPVDAPGRSLTLFSHFLKDEPLPPFDGTSTKA